MDQSKLNRTLDRWAGCASCAIASGSTAQMMYFVDDAKADIATLAAEIDAREELLREANSALAFALNRIHGSSRSRDTELATARLCAPALPSTKAGRGSRWRRNAKSSAVDARPMSSPD
jgi:hypothetical protein